MQVTEQLRTARLLKVIWRMPAQLQGPVEREGLNKAIYYLLLF